MSEVEGHELAPAGDVAERRDESGPEASSGLRDLQPSQKRALGDERISEIDSEGKVAEGAPLPPRKKVKADTPASVESYEADGSHEEGEIVSPSPADGPGQDEEQSTGSPGDELSDPEPVPEPEPELDIRPDPPKAAAGGWNRGVGSTLRTSFAKTTASSNRLRTKPPAAASPAIEEPSSPHSQVSSPPGGELGERDEQDSKSSQPVTSNSSQSEARPPPPTKLTKAGLEWDLPSLREEDKINGKTWQQRFRHWCEDFFLANPDQTKSITPSLLIDALETHLRGLRFRHKKIKTILAAANAFALHGKLDDLIMKEQTGNPGRAPEGESRVEPSARDWAALLGSSGSNAEAQEKKKDTGQENSPKAEDGEVLSEDGAVSPGRKGKDASCQMSVEKELQELEAYFPGVAVGATFCVLCSSRSHRANECREATCRFCQAPDHTSIRCPSRQRCKKCQQLGHAKSSCREKLALAPGEADECAFCASPAHREENCPEVWRSYRADPESMHKVRSIPTFCYFCGSDAHFGGDCALNKGSHSSGRTFVVQDGLWTTASRDMYVDETSDVLAIGWVPPLPPGPPQDGRPHIPGHTIVPRTHVYYSDSDDDNGGDRAFIREPVHPPRAPGQIRFSDLAGSARNQGQARQNGVPNGRRDSGPNIPAGPSHSLPPRPPPPRAPQHAAQNNRRGGGGPGGPPRPRYPLRSDNNQQPGQGRQGPSGQRGGGALGRRGPRLRRGRP